MMQFTVPRGHLRAALTRLLPHAGGSMSSNEGPFGRIRFSLDAHDLLVMWAGDELTRAIATAPVADFKSPEIGVFDLDAAEVALLLASLRPVGSAEARSRWLESDFLVTVGEGRVTFAEYWQIYPITKEVTVPRVKNVEDAYPDIPASILSAISATQAPIVSFEARQTVIQRVVKSAYDYMHLIGIQRQAIIIGGTTLFTAVIPCSVIHGISTGFEQQTDFTDLEMVLVRHITPPSLPTDQDSETVKQRRGWENGFEFAIKPREKN